MAKLRCPRCRGHNIQIMANDINMKQQTVLNVNPLQPFTLFKHKQKKKISGAKLGVAVATLGMSSLVTGGIRKNKQYEVFCVDCGHRWKTR